MVYIGCIVWIHRRGKCGRIQRGYKKINNCMRKQDFFHISEIKDDLSLNNIVIYDIGLYRRIKCAKNIKTITNYSNLLRCQAMIRGFMSRLNYSYIRLKKFRLYFPNIPIMKELLYVGSCKGKYYTGKLIFNPFNNSKIISGNIKLQMSNQLIYNKAWDDVERGKIDFTFSDNIRKEGRIICGSWHGIILDTMLNLIIKTGESVTFSCLHIDIIYKTLKGCFRTSEKISKIIIKKLIPSVTNQQYPYLIIQDFLMKKSISEFPKCIKNQLSTYKTSNYYSYRGSYKLEYKYSKLRLAYSKLAIVLFCKYFKESKYIRIDDIFLNTVIEKMDSNQLFFCNLLSNTNNNIPLPDFTWIYDWYSFKNDLIKHKISYIKYEINYIKFNKKKLLDTTNKQIIQFDLKVNHLLSKIKCIENN